MPNQRVNPIRSYSGLVAWSSHPREPPRPNPKGSVQCGFRGTHPQTHGADNHRIPATSDVSGRFLGGAIQWHPSDLRPRTPLQLMHTRRRSSALPRQSRRTGSTASRPRGLPRRWRKRRRQPILRSGPEKLIRSRKDSASPCRKFQIVTLDIRPSKACSGQARRISNGKPRFPGPCITSCPSAKPRSSRKLAHRTGSFASLASGTPRRLRESPSGLAVNETCRQWQPVLPLRKPAWSPVP